MKPDRGREATGKRLESRGAKKHNTEDGRGGNALP